MTESFLQLLDFDVWANRRWIAALQRFEPSLVGAEIIHMVALPGPWPDFPIDSLPHRAGQVFAHILWAQRIWLERCGTRVQCLDGSAVGWLSALNNGWRAKLLECSPDERIDYRNSSGQAYTRAIGEIFRHVMDHGTYHRGQLREIAQWIPLDPFPETGFAGFLISSE